MYLLKFPWSLVLLRDGERNVRVGAAGYKACMVPSMHGATQCIHERSVRTALPQKEEVRLRRTGPGRSVGHSLAHPVEHQILGDQVATAKACHVGEVRSNTVPSRIRYQAGYGTKPDRYQAGYGTKPNASSTPTSAGSSTKCADSCTPSAVSSAV